MRTLLDQILEPGALRLVFQPIVSIRGGAPRLRGLEALTRGPRGTNLEPPDLLFDFVRRKRAECEVDRHCVELVFGAIVGLPEHFHISVNVHASTLARDPDFPSFLLASARENNVALDRITVEIVEHAPPWDSDSFLSGLEAIRGSGPKIALDDVGLGHSNYKMILDCRPNFFKIDRYFVHGVEADPHRRMVVESVTDLAHRFGGEVVAEGVEQALEVKALETSGVDLVQGFYFSPARPLADLKADGLFELASVGPFAARPAQESRGAA
jgi:EAL domain-containing protein (putative c-di-GMP-specific phosphodiesterase class I)